MRREILAVLAIALTLQACTARYHNTEEAYAPFPEVPANPDGVCPDLTGTYHAYTCSEEPGDEYRSVTPLVNLLGKPVISKESLRSPHGTPTVIPKCASLPVAPRIVSVRYLTAEGKYETRSWDEGAVLTAFTLYDPGSKKPICDKGIRYWHYEGEHHGVEGGNTYKTVGILSKSAEGDLVYKDYSDRLLFAFKTIPTGGSRTVRTYLYKAYHGAVPGN